MLLVAFVLTVELLLTASPVPECAQHALAFLDSARTVMTRPEFSMTRSSALPGELFLQVPVKLLSQNTGYNSHWSVKARHRKDMELVADAMLVGLKPGLVRASGPRLIVIYNRGRADLPNIMGGAKGLIDALVKRGVFIDDNPKQLVFAGSFPAPKHQDPNIRATFYIGDAS